MAHQVLHAGGRWATVRELACRMIACAVLAAASLLSVGEVGIAAAATGGRPLQDGTAPYPPVGAGTDFLDDASYLTGFNEPGWYESNIPFVDLPDKTMQDVYYYRWRVWKEHLRYTNPRDGWVSTEFLDCCGYAAPYQAINAATGHQISEGRWVRDRSYLDDYERFWLTGTGAGPKPAIDDVNADTTDWAHEYSMWLASAAYGRAQVTGDFSHVRALLPQLVKQYRGWDKQFNTELGLYWSVPVWDAMEYSASSYESGNAYHGGAGYRPTLNAYQYGDALAISALARMEGDASLADEYADRAARLKASLEKWLWDPKRGFYYAMARDNNPDHKLSGTREQIGYIPWVFGMARPGAAAAWEQLFDPSGFAAPYGPTTAERRSPWFMHEAGECCRWDGPSWPFATSQTLTGMANLLNDYPKQTIVDKDDYVAALRTYAKTQMRDGRPYVAEAHSPDKNEWIYDGHNRSEDYNHSTFNDLVLSGLLGLRPQAGAELRIEPLVPDSWDHFAAENVPYHGHNVTLLWDRDGSHYGQGVGMRIYIDGRLSRTSPELSTMSVPIGSATATAASPLVNDAANPLREGYPKPIASYTWRYDNEWNALDGKVWFDEVPQNTRWTNYDSPHDSDYYGVDFGVPTTISDVRWYGYDDGGGVRPAADYRLQYWSKDGWQDVAAQQRASAEPVGNGLNRITFPAVTTSRVRLLFTNPPGAYVGVSEFQAWSASSRNATVKVGPTHAIGLMTIRKPTPVDVTVSNTTGKPLRNTVVDLRLPEGWTATRADKRPRTLAPHGSQTWRFVVAPRDDAAPGSPAALMANATYTHPQRGNQSTHHLQNARLAYPEGRREPLGTWTFDEGSGNVAHDSSDGHDISLTGSPGRTPSGSGSALELNGSSQYGQTAGPVLDTTGHFTVRARVRLDRTGSFATAVSQDDTTSSGFYLQYSAADNRLAFSTSHGRALSDDPPRTGQWYDLVGVHDGDAGTYTLYVDGKAQSTRWSQLSGTPSSGPLAVGRAFSGGRISDFWPGGIDQVEVWNRALTPSEITALHGR